MSLMQVCSVTNTNKVLLYLCAGGCTGAFANLGYDDCTQDVLLKDTSTFSFHSSEHDMCTLTRVCLQ